MIYVLVSNDFEIVDRKDLSDIGINGAKTFFMGRKRVSAGGEEWFDSLWKVMTKKEYDLNKEAFERKPSSEQIQWWNDEESYLDIDAVE
tara:strand:- start:1856 stop:2122 length:267 start_codon:yes stop_codon:yes gene_type:complete